MKQKAYVAAGVDTDRGYQVKSTLLQLLGSSHRREVLSKALHPGRGLTTIHLETCWSLTLTLGSNKTPFGWRAPNGNFVLRGDGSLPQWKLRTDGSLPRPVPPVGR